MCRLSACAAVGGRHVEGLADGEQSNSHDDRIDAIEQFRNAEGKARLSGLRIESDRAEEQPEEQRGDPERDRSTAGRVAQHGRHGGKRQNHQGEVVGRRQPERDLHQQRGGEGQSDRADRAGDKRTDRGRRQRLGATAPSRHGVAFDGRHHRSGLAGRVQQDGGRRAAVLRTVVDAGEHDEGGDRRQAHRQGHQDRDRGRRTDPGQDADRSPEGHADDRPDEIIRRERDGKTLGKQCRVFPSPGSHHWSRWNSGSSGPSGRSIPRPRVKTSRITVARTRPMTAFDRMRRSPNA